MKTIKSLLLFAGLPILLIFIAFVYPVLNAKYAFFAQRPNKSNAIVVQTINQNARSSKVMTFGNETFLMTSKENGSEKIMPDTLGTKLSNYDIDNNTYNGSSSYFLMSYYRVKSTVYFLSKLNNDNIFEVIFSNDSSMDLYASPTGQHIFIDTVIKNGSDDPYKSQLYSSDKGQTWNIVKRNWPEYITPIFSSDNEAWAMAHRFSFNSHIENVANNIYYSNDSGLNVINLIPENRAEFVELVRAEVAKYDTKLSEKEMTFENNPRIYPLSDNRILIWETLNLSGTKYLLVQYSLERQESGWFLSHLKTYQNLSISTVKGYENNIYTLAKNDDDKQASLAKFDIKTSQWMNITDYPSIFGIYPYQRMWINDFLVTKDNIIISAYQGRIFHTPLSFLQLEDPFDFSEGRIFYSPHNENSWTSLKTDSVDLVGVNEEKNIYYHNNYYDIYTNDKMKIYPYKLNQ